MALRHGLCSVFLFEGMLLIEQEVSDESRTWFASGWHKLLSERISDAELGEAVDAALGHGSPDGFIFREPPCGADEASYPALLGVGSEGAVIASGSSAVVSRRDSQTNASSYMKSGPRSGWFRSRTDHKEVLESPDALTLGAAVRAALDASTFVPEEPAGHT